MERVKQQMEQARQQRIERKIKEAREKKQRTQKNPNIKRKSSSKLGNYAPFLSIRHDISLVLGGAVAGIVITTIVWWAKSVGTIDSSNLNTLESDGVIHTGSSTSQHNKIDHINKRIELLADNVTDLEAKLMSVIVLTDSINSTENKQVAGAQRHTSNFDGAKATFSTMEPTAAGVSSSSTKNEDEFTPTHTAKAKLNLRPSASLETTPIAILKVGAEIEYISEADGWYYVNTQLHGKGWCSSDYLIPLLPAHKR